MRYYHIAAAAFLASLIIVGPAQACSVVDDYRVPTNLELADQAPNIILGKVVGEVRGESGWDSQLLVEPVETIKGQLPTGILSIEGGGLVRSDDERGFGILSNPYSLEDAHPLSYIGGCIRYMFPKGTTALFFIGQEDGEWHPAGGPFSRWAEDVLTDDAPWLHLTRLYAAVAGMPEAERSGMLGKEMRRLASQTDDPVAQLMARDIARQLAGPNDTWNSLMQRMIDFGPDNEAAAEAIAESLMGSIAEDPAYGAAIEAAPAMLETEQAEEKEGAEAPTQEE